jgi:hypothetical protein
MSVLGKYCGAGSCFNLNIFLLLHHLDYPAEPLVSCTRISLEELIDYTSSADSLNQPTKLVTTLLTVAFPMCFFSGY